MRSVMGEGMLVKVGLYQKSLFFLDGEYKYILFCKDVREIVEINQYQDPYRCDYVEAWLKGKWLVESIEVNHGVGGVACYWVVDIPIEYLLTHHLESVRQYAKEVSNASRGSSHY